MVVIILLALIGFGVVKLLNVGEKGEIIITVDGEEYRKIPFSENTNETFRVEINGDWNDIVIQNGEVDVIAANCPVQVCVDTKPATENGDLIVCLPHKMVIEIVPKK